MEEKDLFSEKLVIEQKKIFFDLKNTPKGDYLKITEKRNNIRNTIKIPAQGLVEFRDTISKIIEFIDSYHQEQGPQENQSEQ